MIIWELREKIGIKNSVPDKIFRNMFEETMKNFSGGVVYTDASKITNGIGCAYLYKTQYCNLKVKVKQNILIFVAEAIAFR